jgi:hypothetical protein
MEGGKNVNENLPSTEMAFLIAIFFLPVTGPSISMMLYTSTTDNLIGFLNC